jgi:processive rubber oxygenase RoxA-like protein
MRRFSRVAAVCAFEEAADILAYKGGPLTGIWASPPHLHNGAAPTLHDLLLPPQDRPASFARYRARSTPRRSAM